MIGRLATGSRGLGWFAVIGRSRVPSPPAMTTAFKGFATPSRFRPLGIPRYRPIHGAATLPTCGLAVALPRLLTWVRYSIAAHQYRTVPQVAKAQPITRASVPPQPG